MVGGWLCHQLCHRVERGTVLANICIIGIWHQGSVLSTCLAEMGHQVCGLATHENVVDELNSGNPPLHEPKLRLIMRRNLREGRLRYTTSYREALEDSEFAYIAFDTPVGPNDESDLDCIFKAAREIARAMSRKLILIISAQVPVGTCEKVAALIRQENPSALPPSPVRTLRSTSPRSNRSQSHCVS